MSLAHQLYLNEQIVRDLESGNVALDEALEKFNDFKEGDIIETYEMVEVKNAKV